MRSVFAALLGLAAATVTAVLRSDVAFAERALAANPRGLKIAPVALRVDPATVTAARPDVVLEAVRQNVTGDSAAIPYAPATSDRVHFEADFLACCLLIVVAGACGPRGQPRRQPAPVEPDVAVEPDVPAWETPFVSLDYIKERVATAERSHMARATDILALLGSTSRKTASGNSQQTLIGRHLKALTAIGAGGDDADDDADVEEDDEEMQ